MRNCSVAKIEIIDRYALAAMGCRSARKIAQCCPALLDDEHNELLFSAASIWEVVIKSSLARGTLIIEPRIFKRGLLDNGYVELPISAEHAVTVESLPMLHKDPFDRILLAQAVVEGILLVTGDSMLAGYSAPVLKV